MLDIPPVAAPLPTAEPVYRPAPSQDQAQAAAPTRSGRLLGMLRKVIDFGKHMLAKVQQDPSAEHAQRIGCCFGTLDIRLILARITRGLELAAELETRIIKHAARIDRPQPAQRAACKPRPRSAPQPQQNQPGPACATFPTAKQLAGQFRRRPIGVVLMEICGNLGLTTGHPLWRELSLVVEDHGGSFAAFQENARKRRALTNFLPPDAAIEWPKLVSCLEQELAPQAAATGPPPAHHAEPQAA